MNVKDKQECLLFILIKLPSRTVFNFNHCGNFWMFCLPKKTPSSVSLKRRPFSCYSYCLAQGLQKPSSVHWTKLLYELHRHLVWITYTFTEVFTQAFLTKLNCSLQKLRRPELAVYLLMCFSRQPKWLRFSPGNLTATSRTHTPADHGWCLHYRTWPSRG